MPFNEVPDEDFEHLCDRLVGFEPGIVSTGLKRTGGVAQYGADVEGFDDRHRRVLVLSAKRYQKVSRSAAGSRFTSHAMANSSSKRRMGIDAEANNGRRSGRVAHDELGLKQHDRVVRVSFLIGPDP